jgi:endonuclease/exonuclease/phosphatase (EEP) superfamily protein YafD
VNYLDAADELGLSLGAVALVVTALSLTHLKAWWVRACDFPRVQVLALAAVAVALVLWRGDPRAPVGIGFLGVMGVVLLVQAGFIWRYTRLAPREVQRADGPDDPSRTLSLVISNVLQTNRDAERLVAVVGAARADVMLFVETDAWWQARLDAAFGQSHPHGPRKPLDNTYGMLLYSRHPLDDAKCDFLLQPDIPSMQAKLRLPDGHRVWLNAVHPRPPAPGEADESLERDAELLLVGKRVADSPLPVVVCGDLNDVAWSHTTRLFQKTSRLLDPRKGRGFFSTFHANIPVLRWPLDHVFHSDHFRLVLMRRLGHVGSDHFPVQAILRLEPGAVEAQEAPHADAEDLAEVEETVDEARETVQAVPEAVARAAQAPPRRGGDGPDA